jgi:mannonate dehydratase
MRIADYLLDQPDIQWKYAAQMGIKYAVGRMPDAKVTETARQLPLLKAMLERYMAGGFELVVIEPAPPNQKIKLNLPGRDEEIETMCRLIQHMGQLGIEVLCFNFVAHFNWLRTHLSIPDRGGALVSGYDHQAMENGELTEWGVISEAMLWSNLEYLLKTIVPVAEEAGVKLAIHPDDPPVSPIRGIGRILTSADAVEKAINLVPSPNLGVTLCQGTYAAMGEDIPATIHRFGRQGKLFYVHFRDIRGNKFKFQETFHDEGITDMAACIRAYQEVGYDGYARVDHVPTMAGEENHRPGYESLGRLFAVGYLKGMLEMAKTEIDSLTTG